MGPRRGKKWNIPHIMAGRGKMDAPQRKSIRLHGYNYSSGGAYFVTIGARDVALSEIVPRGDECPDVRLTPTGEIVEKYVVSMNRSKGVFVENYVIMPDHIHLLIFIENPAGELPKSNDPAQEKIPRVVSGFKRLVNKETGRNIFQRSYFDRIVRNDREYEKISQYIDDNPASWLMKKEWQKIQPK